MSAPDLLAGRAAPRFPFGAHLRSYGLGELIPPFPSFSTSDGSGNCPQPQP